MKVKDSVNKHKKGFTLIELLAVIVILAVILAIATASVIGNINDSKEKAKYVAANEIVSIAATYLATQKDEVSNNCVLVKTLVEKDYLEKDVTNPLTGKNGGFESDNDSKVCKDSTAKKQDNYKPKGNKDSNEAYYSFDGYKYVFKNDGSIKTETPDDTPDNNQGNSGGDQGNTDGNQDNAGTEVCLNDEKYVCDKNNPTKIVGLTDVGKDTFRGGEDVFIPYGTTEIGMGAFFLPFYEEYTGETLDINFFEGGSLIESKKQAFMDAVEKIDELKNDSDYVSSLPTVGIMEIPETVKKIGPFAFAGLNFRGDLRFYDGLEEVSYYAFYNSGFDGMLEIPESLQTINLGSFSKMGFSGELYVPGTVKKIEIGAFIGTKFDTASVSKNTQYNVNITSGVSLISFDKDTKVNVR